MPDTAAVTQPETAPSPTVKLVSGPAFELVAELAAFASGPARASLESGKTWIRDVRRLAGADLLRRVERWAFPLYTELAPIVLDAGEPFEPEGVVEALRRHPADALRRRLLGAESPPNRAMVSDGAFDRALAGNRRARAEVRRTLGLNPPARQSIDRLLTTDPESVQDEIVSIVEDWGSRVFPTFADRSNALVRRDIEAKEQAVPRRARGRGAACVDERGRVRSRRVGDRHHPHPDRRAAPIHRAGRIRARGSSSSVRSQTRRSTTIRSRRPAAWSRSRLHSGTSCGCGSCMSWPAQI